MWWPLAGVAGVLIAIVLAFPARDRQEDQRSGIGETGIASLAAGPGIDPLIFMAVPGDGALEREIADRQRRLFDGGESAEAACLENLGWLFVAKARQSGEPILYTPAKRCAEELARLDARRLDALLLGGHIAHQLHEFDKAEAIARRLVEERGRSFDYGLLGDALLERGALEDAAAAYQKMMDLRPGLPAYTRAGEIRWRKGDLEGAIEAMELAVRSGSARNPEPLAWAYSRMAFFHLEAGAPDRAALSLAAALKLFPGYAPALAVQTRISANKEH